MSDLNQSDQSDTLDSRTPSIKSSVVLLGGLIGVPILYLPLLLFTGIGWYIRDISAEQSFTQQENEHNKIVEEHKKKHEEDSVKIANLDKKYQEAEDKAFVLSIRINGLVAEIARRDVREKDFQKTISNLQSQLSIANNEALRAQSESHAAKMELEAVRESKRQVTGVLINTATALEDSRQKTIDRTWRALTSEARSQVCKDYNFSEKQKKCETSVNAALSSLRPHFDSCWTNGGDVQALIAYTTSKSPPNNGYFLGSGPDSDLTKGWYVVFCDRNLPEKK